MADNRFSLQKIRAGVRHRAEELRHSEDADVKSRDDIARSSEGPMKPFTFQQEDYDRTEAPKDEMRKYWRQFETTPIVRSSITSFASQVTAPGYYLTARDVDDEVLEDLDHWLNRGAIIEGEPGKDFRLLAKKAMIQREVRGTALIEKAPDRNDDEQIAGLKLINPETMEAVTRPGQSILLDPEDIDEFDDAPEAESGGAAAYLQDLSETQTFFGTPVRKDFNQDGDEEYKIGFRRDEVIKLTRDADVGEIFGTSRIEAVSDRIDGLKQKLEDNDEAIASKAYPLWLFLFGSEDNPWESDDINQFMNAHEMSNFHPGMKQGVRGDVDVKTISGEVAEISEALDFDINWIMSAMPMPKWALGAFGGAPGQVDGMVQQQDINRQINEARRELENEFTPLVQEVAQQMGVEEDNAETIRLKIGKPNQPETTTTPRENIIRYIPKDQREAEDEPQVQGDGTPVEDDDGVDAVPPGEGQQPGNQPGNDASDIVEDASSSEETLGAQVWHAHSSMEQLTIEADDTQKRLADKIHETLVGARDEALGETEERYSSSTAHAASHFESLANNVVRQRTSRGRFRDDVRPLVEEDVESVMDEMNATTGAFTRSQNVRHFIQDIEHSTSDALEEMMRLMRVQIRRGAMNNEEWGDIEARLRDEYNDANLRQRAELIAHMELRNAESTTRLQQWEKNPNVVGIRVVNQTANTPLTESLNGAEAYFEKDGSIGEQWMEQTREEFLHKGFSPIPPTPPFHFNDTSRLEPITRR